MAKQILVSDEIHKELMKEAGSIQQRDGKFVGLPRLIGLILEHWRLHPQQDLNKKGGKSK